MKDFMKDDVCDIGEEPILVAVKILREDATKNARYNIRFRTFKVHRRQRQSFLP